MLSGEGNNSTIQAVSTHLLSDIPLFTTVHGTAVSGLLAVPTGLRQLFLRPAGNGARLPECRERCHGRDAAPGCRRRPWQGGAASRVLSTIDAGVAMAWWW